MTEGARVVQKRVAACFHGFLRTGASMWWMARTLRRAGYLDVALPTFGYHLTPLDVHAPRAVAAIAALRQKWPDATIDLVTHSFGGILARAALGLPAVAAGGAPRVRRVVMLSPPNQGALLAEQVRKVLPFHRMGWDPLHQITPGVPAARPLPGDIGQTEFGVLTGGTGEKGWSPWLGEDNDGKVRVDEAWLEGASDFLVVPVRHSMMPFSPLSHQQAIAFLETGRFARP
ncbi:MAG: esterase/lipase family protein [Myxococcota bacterium]